MDETQQKWKTVENTSGGYEDNEDENEKIEKTDFFPVFALEYKPNLQTHDPELAEIITYLNTVDLSVSDKSARKIIMIADQFTVQDGILWHFYSSRSRYKKGKLISIKQLRISLSLKLDILKSYHEQGTSHKIQMLFLRQSDKILLV